MEMQRCENSDALRHYENVQALPTSLRVAGRISQDRQRVIHIANILLEPGHDFFNEGKRWSFEDVINELINHTLFAHCMAQVMSGDSAPLKDLTIRVARHLAASILKIDADEIGLFI